MQSSQQYSYGNGPAQPLHYPLPSQPRTTNYTTWTPQNDEILLNARAKGMDWQPIQAQYFPDKTPNSCRKRHERLITAINNHEDWGWGEMKELGEQYIALREKIWKPLAEQIDEKWMVVESKCMQEGIKNLQHLARTPIRDWKSDQAVVQSVNSYVSRHNRHSTQLLPFHSLNYRDFIDEYEYESGIEDTGNEVHSLHGDSVVSDSSATAWGRNEEHWNGIELKRHSHNSTTPYAMQNKECNEKLISPKPKAKKNAKVSDSNRSPENQKDTKGELLNIRSQGDDLVTQHESNQESSTLIKLQSQEQPPQSCDRLESHDEAAVTSMLMTKAQRGKPREDRYVSDTTQDHDQVSSQSQPVWVTGTDVPNFQSPKIAKGIPLKFANNFHKSSKDVATQTIPEQTNQEAIFSELFSKDELCQLKTGFEDFVPKEMWQSLKRKLVDQVYGFQESMFDNSKTEHAPTQPVGIYIAPSSESLRSSHTSTDASSEISGEVVTIESRIGRQRDQFFSLRKHYFTIKTMASKTLRPKVRPGYRRIEWICGCGKALYADFEENNSESIKKMTELLQHPNHTNTENKTASGSSITSNPNQDSSPNTTPSQSMNSPISGTSPLSTFEGSPNSSVCSISSNIRKSYLELCVNTGEYTKTPSEIDLTSVRSDGQLFLSIRKEYSRLRGFRSRFWLLKPSRADFVRFSVQFPQLVGILQKPLAIPPESEVDSKKYEYEPCPLGGDPPIPQDIFLHSLKCSAPDWKKAWLPRLPRKIDECILGFTGDVAYGWGIHVNEGPDYFLICVINIYLMALSGVAAFLWKYFERDFSGAFTFAGWIVAVTNGVVVAYVAKWQSE